MIDGAHVIIYSRDPDADRAFLRDVLGFGHVDAGDGWLIFELPPAEVAVHPADAPAQELYLMCSDLDGTLTELAAKGAAIDGDVQYARWGTIARIRLPSGTTVPLYEPKHPRAAGR
ncbi:VOC family protein [Amycolatopsis panacis]|uniref:Extradiol dioxygenase n=1 Tax=Amycolatopsis panacis TaxID=2340917 RepID=A0A419I8F4_9PSEU|nr:extradiol dioxygenase [Amycolatopsis panacis]RJQ88225.1 extradiol dioxygenase [Amycolatopsis panacis]